MSPVLNSRVFMANIEDTSVLIFPALRNVLAFPVLNDAGGHLVEVAHVAAAGVPGCVRVPTSNIPGVKAAPH